MKKFFSFVFTLSCMTAFLAGCQEKDLISSENNNTTKQAPSEQVSSEQPTDKNEIGIVDKEIKKVSFSKPKGNSAFVFEDEFSLEVLKKVISSAAKKSGIVNMTNPDFEIEILYEDQDNQHFLLWLGGKFEESTLMKTDDSHTIYILPEESTNKIIDLMD